MAEITFTKLREFDSATDKVYAINKFNGLVFISVDDGDVWTYNIITGRFLLNSTPFGAGNSARAFKVIPASGNSNIVEGTFYAVTGGTDGKLFVYDNDGTWTEKADTGDAACTSLEFYKDNLYYGTSDGEEVFKWDGSSQTTSLAAATTAGAVNALKTYQENLFAAADPQDVFIFDNSSWSLEADLAVEITEVRALEIYNDELYVGGVVTAPTTNLWKRDNDAPSVYIEVARITNRIYALEVFKDKLYTSGDSIVAWDGADEAIKFVETSGIANTISLFADGNIIFFGTDSNATQAEIYSMTSLCSDEILISDASPFGWNVGDCEIIPSVDDIEDGVFSDKINSTDPIKVQVQYNAQTPPRFFIEDSDGEEIHSQDFINVVGIIHEVETTTSVIGEHKFLIKKPQTGASAWTAVTDQGATDIGEVIVISESIFCVTIGQRVFRTADIGVTWTEVADNGAGTFISIAYDRVNDIAVAVTSDKDIWVSTDLGVTWAQKTDITTTGVNKVTVAGGVIFGSGGSGTVSKSLDEGDSWTAVNVSTARNLTAIFALDDQTVWVGTSGTGDALHHTTNGGAGWAAQAPAAGTQAFNDIFFFNASVGIAGRTVGALQYTSDGGTNWLTATTGIANGINGVFMTSATVGFLTADGGDLLTTTDAGANWSSVSDALGAIDLNDIDGISDDEGHFLFVGADSGQGEYFDARTSFTELANAPCVLFDTAHDNSILIKYTNDTNFTGFDYTNGLVNQIRIIAHFWKPVNPQTQSIYEQSGGDVVTLKTTVKKGFILETELMPEYMHRKLTLIFKHTGIEINGISYYGNDASYEFETIEGFRQAHGKITLLQRTLLDENII